jgi:nucleotide-binding universal stress UspA family protein
LTEATANGDDIVPTIVTMSPNPKEPTMPATHPIVVVGYDGTPAARAAVSRGIERVSNGGHLVVAQTYQVAADPHSTSYGEFLEDAADEAARSLDQLAADDVRFDSVDWERSIHEGEPASTLCRVAAEHGADELIIGTRGRDRVGVFLGSVASGVLHLADRPVTVIPKRMVSHNGHALQEDEVHTVTS